MARIRSVHPGQWTDEAFVACSFPARLLAIALRNEADDNGVFEWKPLGLKMKLFPADNVDMDELLAEIERCSHIRRVEYGGKSYGLIRNFRRYQRPEKPKAQHPLADEDRAYVGLVTEQSAIKTQPEAVNSGNSRGHVADQSPTDHRKPPQRKEEGGNGRMEEEQETALPLDRAEARASAHARGARLAIEALPEDWRAFCVRHRRDLNPDATWQRFRDYWIAKPGKDGRKADWPATWRNWVRNEKPPHGQAAPVQRDFSNY